MDTISFQNYNHISLELRQGLEYDQDLIAHDRRKNIKLKNKNDSFDHLIGPWVNTKQHIRSTQGKYHVTQHTIQKDFNQQSNKIKKINEYANFTLSSKPIKNSFYKFNTIINQSRFNQTFQIQRSKYSCQKISFNQYSSINNEDLQKIKQSRTISQQGPRYCRNSLNSKFPINDFVEDQQFRDYKNQKLNTNQNFISTYKKMRQKNTNQIFKPPKTEIKIINFPTKQVQHKRTSQRINIRVIYNKFLQNKMKNTKKNEQLIFSQGQYNQQKPNLANSKEYRLTKNKKK